MGCNIPNNNNKKCEYTINNNIFSDTKRIDLLNLNNIDNKTTTDTYKKELVKNIEEFNKEAMQLYSNYNNKDNNNKETLLKEKEDYVKLKIYNSSNILFDEIIITKNSIISKYNIKKYDKCKKFSFGKDIANDYRLNDNSITQIQFYIYYNENKKKFYIMDNLSGTGTFVKINDKLTLNQNMIISFLVDFIYIDYIKLGEIKLIFLKKNKNKEEKSEIIINSNNKVKFTIGRKKTCDYIYDDYSISKVQCTLIYEKGNWIIYDGDYDNFHNKKSTNGIWLLTRKGVLIENGMIFKSGNLKIYSYINDYNK